MKIFKLFITTASKAREKESHEKHLKAENRALKDQNEMLKDSLEKSKSFSPRNSGILPILFFILFLFGCQKKDITPQPLPVQVYEFSIKYTNKGEPEIMRTYTVYFNNNWYYTMNTDHKIDLKSLKWYYSKDFPMALYLAEAKRVYPDTKIDYSFIQNLK